MDYRKNEDGSLVIRPITKNEKKFLDCLLDLIKAWQGMQPVYEADGRRKDK